MDQSTTPKPVMDVTPPKPATPAPSPDVSPALASHQSETVAASQSGSDRNEAAPTLREPGAAGREQDGGSKESLAVHTAPPLSDDDKASAAQKAAEPQAAHPKPTAHSGAPKTHGPAGAITFVILAMLVLSTLAVLVYLNS